MSLWVLPFWDRPAQTVVLVLNSQEIIRSVNFLLIWGARSGAPPRLLADVVVKPVSTRGSTILDTVTPFVILPTPDDEAFSLRIEAWSNRGREATVPLSFFADDGDASVADGRAVGLVLDPARLGHLQSPFSTESVAAMILPHGIEHLTATDEARIEEARQHGGTVVLSPTVNGRIGPMTEHAGAQDALQAGFAAGDLEERSNPWAGEAFQIWVDLGTDPLRAQEIDKRLVFGFERYADPADVQAGRRTEGKSFGRRPVFIRARDGDPSLPYQRRLERVGSDADGFMDEDGSDEPGRWIARCDFFGLAHLDRAFVLHAGGARLYLEHTEGGIAPPEPAPVQSFAFMGRRAIHDEASGEAQLRAFRRARSFRSDAAPDQRAAPAGTRGLDTTLPGQSLLTETAYTVLAGRLSHPESDPALTQNLIPTLKALGIDFHKASSVVRHAECVFALLLRDVRAQVRHAVDRVRERPPKDRPMTCMELMVFALSAQDPGAGAWVARLGGDDILSAWTAFRTGRDLVPFIRVGIPFDTSLTEPQLRDLEVLAGLLRLQGLEGAVDAYFGAQSEETAARHARGMTGLAARCRRIEDALIAYRQELETVIDSLPSRSLLGAHLDEVFLAEVMGEDPAQAARALIDGVHFAAEWDRHREKTSSLRPFDALAPLDAEALARIGQNGTWSSLTDTMLTILERIYADWVARCEQTAGALKILAGRFAVAFDVELIEDDFAAMLEGAIDMAEQAYRIGIKRSAKDPGNGLATTIDRLAVAMNQLPQGFLESEAGERLLAFVDFMLEQQDEVASGLQSLLQDKAAREEEEANLAQVALTLGFSEAAARAPANRDALFRDMAKRLEELAADILSEVGRARTCAEGIRNLPRADVPDPVMNWAHDLEGAASDALTARQRAAPLVDALSRAVTTPRPAFDANGSASGGDRSGPPRSVVFRFRTQDDEIVRRLVGNLTDLQALCNQMEAIVDQFAAHSPYRDQVLNALRGGRWTEFRMLLTAHRHLTDTLAPQIQSLKLDGPMVEDLSDLLLVFALDNPAIAERLEIPGLYELRRLMTGENSPNAEEIEIVQWEIDRLQDVIAEDDKTLTARGFLDRRRREFREKLRRVRERILSDRRSPAAEAMVPSIGQVELVREGLKWWRIHYDTVMRNNGPAELDPDLVRALTAERLLPRLSVDL
ncbi:MAG: hypothetical protein ACFB6R_00215 [Alphaproteobacteria bacterium]